MNPSLSLLGFAALFALAGCAHENRDAAPATSPTSDTMQSQTNDATLPYRFPMTDGSPRPDARILGVQTDPSVHDFSDLTPVGRLPHYRDRSGFPAPNSSNPPLPSDGIPSAP